MAKLVSLTSTVASIVNLGRLAMVVHLYRTNFTVRGGDGCAMAKFLSPEFGTTF